MNPQIGFLLNKSIECLRNSNLESAETYLMQALKLQSDNPHVLRLLGVVYAQRKQYTEAIQYLKKSLQALPKNALTLSNLGNIFLEIKEYANALDAYDKAIKVDDRYEEAWTNKGNALYELKRYDEAIIHHNAAIKLRPDYALAYSNKGNALHELKRYDEAIAHYEKAINLWPDYAEAYTNKGNALHELKRYEEAIAHYDKAIGLRPDYAQAYTSKGNTLHELKLYEEAITYYDKAISLRPDYAAAYSNMGNSLNELKLYEEAIAHYDKAISLRPDYVEAYSNSGNTLHELKRYEEAIAQYDKAIGLRPDYAAAYLNKANSLIELKLYNEAIAQYDKAIDLKPNIDWAYGSLVHTKLKACNWNHLERDYKNISDRVLEGHKVAHPFMLFAINDDVALHKQATQIYVQDKLPINQILGPIPKRSPKNKIRIAYFSADFRIHPVSFLTAELFEIHDRDQFEVIAFSLQKSADDDFMNERLRRGFDQFIDAESMSDLEIAQMARHLEVDIAIDLSGLTQHSRTRIFSYRAAPIQVSWLGYAGTIGSEYIDYLVADKVTIPENHQQFYVEKIAYLPHTFMTDDSKRIASSKKFTRESCGLPKDAFVFCCFNNDYKFNPLVLDSWSRILQRVDNSVLWISENNPLFNANLKSEFEKRSIDSARIVFAQREELMVDHLARYSQADLFLDTHPYNAHTTALDSLKAGVPILTLLGQSFASRVAASLLNAIELPELITTNLESYEQLAIELAHNPHQLADIKSKLANNLLTSPLFNTHLFAKNLEAAYSAMHQKYHADLSPEHISISSCTVF